MVNEDAAPWLRHMASRVELVTSKDPAYTRFEDMQPALSGLLPDLSPAGCDFAVISERITYPRRYLGTVQVRGSFLSGDLTIALR